MAHNHKLIRCMVLFAIDLPTRRVEMLGTRVHPNGTWMEQIARNMTWDGTFLLDKKYLIHDGDPLFTSKFRNILKTSDIEPVRLPPGSPNLNECLCGTVRQIHQRGGMYALSACTAVNGFDLGRFDYQLVSDTCPSAAQNGHTFRVQSLGLTGVRPG